MVLRIGRCLVCAAQKPLALDADRTRKETAAAERNYFGVIFTVAERAEPVIIGLR